MPGDKGGRLRLSDDAFFFSYHECEFPCFFGGGVCVRVLVRVDSHTRLSIQAHVFCKSQISVKAFFLFAVLSVTLHNTTPLLPSCSSSVLGVRGSVLRESSH